MTEKLYDKDAYMDSFTAKVIECIKEDKGYKIVLDKTAFFPEGGGQTSDKGKIDDVEVYDVREKDDVIYHYTKEEIEVGKEVEGKIDFETRYDKMRCHTAEHIMSGLIHAKFGSDNVGFHLSDTNEITFDFSSPVTNEDMREIEEEANRVVAENIKVEVNVYDSKDIKDLDYRSKLDFTGDVRIVKIGDYDICACCAPHVAKTGEIGVIKVVKTESYKGGIRIYMLAGTRAYEDYKKKDEIVSVLSKELSANKDNLIDKYAKKMEEIEKLKAEKASIINKLADVITESIDIESNEIIDVIRNDLDSNLLREVANKLMNKSDKIIRLFRVEDEKISYLITARDTSVKEVVDKMNNELVGRGGGKPNSMQGSIAKDLDKLKAFLKANN